MYLPVFFERHRRNAYQSEEAEPKHASPPIFSVHAYGLDALFKFSAKRSA